MPDEPIDSYVRRISVSLSQTVFEELDQLVRDRGFDSRSQAIAQMVHDTFTENNFDRAEDLMAGTITLVYDEAKPRLLKEIAEIQRQHINEVIASHRILLDHGHILEVILVQGPGHLLKIVSNELITCKGVISGRLAFTSSLIPQLHAAPKPTDASL